MGWEEADLSAGYQLYGALLFIHYWLVITGSIKPAEDAQESGTKHFIRLKRDIWHRAVYEIVKSIEMIAKTGYSMICGDGIERRVFPWISMLSADYEEQ